MRLPLSRLALLAALCGADSRTESARVDDDVRRAAEALGAGPGEAAVYRNGNLTGESAWMLRSGDGWRRVRKSQLKLYDVHGAPLKSLRQAQKARLAFAADLDRENWILPSIGAGLSRPVRLPTPPGWRPAGAAEAGDQACPAAEADGWAFELETLSERPRVFRVNGFLSDEEADHLRAVAGPSMKQSTIANPANGGSQNAKDADMRNSDTAWLPPRFGKWNSAEWSDGVDPVLQGVVARGSKLLHMDPGLCDGLQVLRCE